MQFQIGNQLWLKHGHAKSGNHSPTYNTWAGMLNRCRSRQSASWKYYGGRGISVCIRWHSFELFLQDMGEKPTGHSLDRINNNGNYEPSNCRWAKQSAQTRNSRRNRILEYGGTMWVAKDLATHAGINYGTLRLRLKKGMTVYEAIHTPTSRSLLTVDGITKTRAEWARAMGFRGAFVITSRLGLGWSVRDAVLMPYLKGAKLKSISAAQLRVLQKTEKGQKHHGHK